MVFQECSLALFDIFLGYKIYKSTKTTFPIQEGWSKVKISIQISVIKYLCGMDHVILSKSHEQNDFFIFINITGGHLFDQNC